MDAPISTGETSVDDAAKAYLARIGAQPQGAGEPSAEAADVEEDAGAVEATATEEPGEADASADSGEEAQEGETAAEAETEDPVLEIEIDGKIRKFTEPELKASILRQDDYTRKTQALAAERRGFESDVGKFRQLAEQSLTELGQSLKWARAQFNPEAEIQKINALRDTDPGAAALALQDLKGREEALRRAEATYEAQMRVARQQEVDRQFEALIEREPAWKDRQKWGADFQKIGSVIGEKYGITPQEWSEVMDHRFVLIARDAMKYHEATRAADLVRTKVREKAPRVLRPGTGTAPGEGSETKYRHALDKHRQSGTVDSAVSAYLARQARRQA